MALFQPTNVIPSSFTVGVVDAKDNAQISWQVNGNSPMTAYRIDFFANDTSSTQVPDASTERSTFGIPAGGFYGTDRFGQPKIFTWKPSSTRPEYNTWTGYNPLFANGKQFKYKITQYWQEGSVEKSIEQLESNAFVMRDTPTLTVYLTDMNYEAQTAFSDGQVLSSSIGYFKANYVQAQGDAVRSVRWQVATLVDGAVGEIIADTGTINTPTLQFEFNGFFNEQSYAIRCTVESEGGQQAITSGANSDGWISFTVNATAQGSYSGSFTLQCLPKENATLLRWTNDELPPTVSGDYILNDGSVSLSPNAAIKWEKASGFIAPWTVAFNLNIIKSERFQTTITNLTTNLTRVYTAKGLISSVDVSCTVGGPTRDPVSVISADKHSCTVYFSAPSWITYDAVITLYETPFDPIGELAKIETDSGSLSVLGSLSDERIYTLSFNGTSIDMNDVRASQISLVLTPSKMFVYGSGSKYKDQTYTLEQAQFKSIQIGGGTSGVTFRNVTVYNGDVPEGTLTRLYANPNFKPSWYADDYELQMTANFLGDIDGGEIAKFRIYRQEIGQNSLFPLYYADNGRVLQIKDYGIVSRKQYTYWLYEYDKNNAYLKGAQCTRPGSDETATISTCFRSYSLLVCDYDSAQDAYHVRKQYIFALNLSEGSVGNNNSPTLNANFTAYPTRMPSTQNYASGTLQGLIGAIYTVPALAEQIGNFKHTLRPSTLDYFDSVDLEKELRDLSVTSYTLFLRDMKGHIRIIATNGAVTTSTNLQQRQQSITISLPWVEIGDASDVSIIQTPEDEAWGGSEELNVDLDVDPATGTAFASYPKPYNGTKFLLVGAENAKKRG